MERINQKSSDGPQQGPCPMPPFSGPAGQQNFAPPQSNNMGPPPLGPSFMSPAQMGASSGHGQGMMGPPDMQRHSATSRNMSTQGPHNMGPGARGMPGPHGGMMGPPARGMGPRDLQGPLPQGGMMPPPSQGNMMGPQGGMMGHPSRTHNNFGMGGMHGPLPSNMQAPPYMQHQVSEWHIVSPRVRCVALARST